MWGTGPVRADELSTCGGPTQRWAGRCAAAQHLDVRPEACSEHGAIFTIGIAGGTDSLKVEANRDPARSFRRVGAVGLSPIGNFPDWEREPQSLRSALDAFAACLERDADVFHPGGDPLPNRAPDTGPRQPQGRGGPPWLLLAGLALTIALCFVRDRRTPASTRRTLVAALPLLGLAAATWLLHRAFITPAYFHQDGEGPLWIGYFLATPPNWYGPGYYDLYSAIARYWPRGPDDGVFLAQSLLVATAPVSAWVLARSLGGGRRLAWAVALCVAVEPVLARVGRSESYFAPTITLLFAAAAVLAAGARTLRLRSPRHWLSVAAAGFFIAQAARVHPYCWIPAAFTPAVLLFGPGPLRRKLRAAALAGLGIGLVVLVCAAPAMRLTLFHGQGDAWRGRASEVFRYRLGYFSLSSFFGRLLWLGGLLLLARQRLHVAVALAIAAIAAMAAVLTKLQLAQVQPWIDHGYYLLYAPILSACLVGVLARIRRGPRTATALALLVAALGTTYSATHWRALTRLATDSAEARLVTEWTSRLPDGARLTYLGEVGQRMQQLPIHPNNPRHLANLRMTPEKLGEVLRDPGPLDYYLHSSLCSTDEGRAACEAAEARLRLDPIEHAELPAVPSMLELGYDRPTVPVVLYRVLPPLQATKPDAAR